jgi:hypothetical protein
MRHLSLPLALVIALSVAACDVTNVYSDTEVASVPLVFRFNDASFNGAVASIQYTMPEISQPVVDHGVVMVYFRDQGTWSALPYAFGVESGELPAVDYTVSIGYGFERRMLEIFVELSTPDVWDAALDRLQSRYDMRAVVIRDRAFGKNAPDLTNYEAVRDYYGLPD